MKQPIAVIPTDTLYGIVGSALSKNIVERIYKLRRRDPGKPMIVLVASFGDLKKLAIRPSPQVKKILTKYWPGKVSVVFPIAPRSRFLVALKYLHRGTGTLAIRLPEPKWLRSLLRKTGPLVAPSANFEGKAPAKTIREAKKYFGDKVDLYIDAGILNSKPSTLIKIEKGKVIVLRKGAVKVW